MLKKLAAKCHGNNKAKCYLVGNFERQGADFILQSSTSDFICKLEPPKIFLGGFFTGIILGGVLDEVFNVVYKSLDHEGVKGLSGIPCNNL